LKPGVRKNAVHTLFAGKGEGASIFGARSRQRWNMFKRGAQRHLKPGVFIEPAPTGEDRALRRASFPACYEPIFRDAHLQPFRNQA